MESAGASDLHLAAGSVLMIRADGRLEKTRHHRLSSDEVKRLTREILSDGRSMRVTVQLDGFYEKMQTDQSESAGV